MYLAAVYFIVVAATSAFIGQRVMNKVVAMFGIASLVIFVLAFTIFVSAVSLGLLPILSLSPVFLLDLLKLAFCDKLAF